MGNGQGQRGGGSALATRTAALARGGTFVEAKAIDAFLREAAELGHLISPATTASELPEGTAIACSAVRIEEEETYPIPGSSDRGLGKAALDRIAGAAGVEWDPNQCRRLDDGRDPRYCCYQAVGYVRTFDGSRRTITAQKEVDVRPGSPQVEELVDICHRKIRKELDRRAPPEGSAADGKLREEGRQRAKRQVRAIALHILSQAESKAKNRAIRSLGVRTSYTKEALKRPFIVAKPVFTGHSDDPHIRRENAAAIREAFLGSSAAVYGQPPALPAPVLHAPPPLPYELDHDAIEASGEDVTDLDMDGETGECPEPAPKREAPKAEPAAPASSGAPKERPAGKRSSMTLPFGRSKGRPITEVSEEDLTWVADKIRGHVGDESKAHWREANQRDLGELERELAWRRGEDEPPDPRGEGDGNDQYRDEDY